METSSDDDIFSSLGGSLMKDLLSDIAGDEGSSSGRGVDFDDDIFKNLASLEKELDRTTDTSKTPAPSLASPPPGMGPALASPPPGLSLPSAGALVVGHASERMLNSSQQTSQTPTGNTGGEDAWAASLSQFSALSLTEDFLKADSAKKKQKAESSSATDGGERVSNDLVDELFNDDVEEYDVSGEVKLGKDGRNIGVFFPGINNGEVSTNTVAKEEDDQRLSKEPSGKGPGSVASPNPNPPPENHPMMLHRGSPMPMPPPPGTNTGMFSPGGPPPPPHVMAMMRAQQGMMSPPGPMPPQMVPPHMMRPPPHMMGPPPHMPPHMMGPPPHMPPHMMMQHQQQSFAPNQIPFPPPMNRKDGPQNDLEKESVFKKDDFPALGAESPEKSDNSNDNEEKGGDQPLVPTVSSPNVGPHASVLTPEIPPPPRITFQNPSPNAPPIPATAISSTTMTPRDLCHVLHSMMRPMLTFSSVLDAYNADYYRWSYDDRKSRNLLFLGGASAPGKDLPNPVWKETKVKAREMEETFRESVEKRATEWSKDKHILGKVVKVNVKRPRALLATSTLSTSLSSGEEGKTNDLGFVSSEYESEEDFQRATLWGARLAVDKGYSAYLNLVELRRLLQSRHGDSLVDEAVEGKREELLMDVEDNVSKLHLAFGVEKGSKDNDGNKEDAATLRVNNKVLSRTLSLPKGRMLLSRVIDEGILPHPSACCVLPETIKVVFESSTSSPVTGAPPPGEDRLLRSMAGLVRTIHPSVHPKNLLDCLACVIDANSNVNAAKGSMKSLLSGKRTLMELLYAVLTRGSELCTSGGDFNDEWESMEVKFMSLLS